MPPAAAAFEPWISVYGVLAYPPSTSLYENANCHSPAALYGSVNVQGPQYPSLPLPRRRREPKVLS